MPHNDMPRSAPDPRDAPPLWAVGADAVGVLLGVLALGVALFGGFRITVGESRLSITTGWRVALLAAIVIALRHAVHRHPSLFVRLRDAARAWRDHPACRVVTPLWLATRLGIVVVGLLAVAMIGFPTANAGFRVSQHELANLPARWDTGWYLGIAVEGYAWMPESGDQQNVAFFPAYPLLMRAGGMLLGSHAPIGSADTRPAARLHTRTMLAGWIISLAASYAALWYLYTWAAAAVGVRAAVRAVGLLATFPFALFQSAAYTESLYLLGMLAAFVAASSGRWAAVGGWGLFVGLLRPNGFLLAAPLAVLVWARAPRQAGAWTAAAAPAAGVLLFTAYIWHLTGSPFTWLEAHGAWGRSLSLTWEAAVLGPMVGIAHHGFFRYLWMAPIDALNAAAVVFVLAMLPAVLRYLGPAAALLVVINLVPPLLAGGFMSMGRVSSTLFPLFVALGVVLPARLVTPWLIGASVIQALLAVLFFTWRPLV